MADGKSLAMVPVTPVWAPSGRELFFRSFGSRDMMVVEVETEPTFNPGNPELLFVAPYYRPAGVGRGRPFDVAEDGRFLMIRESNTGQEAEPSSQILVVLNWHQELLERVPAP